MNRLENFRYWLILTALCFWLSSSLVGNKNFDTTIYSDSEGYYMYLPAVFLYGSFENLPVRTTAEYQFYPNTNKIATRFTYGVAVMLSPFWAIAHVFKTKVLGKTAIDSFSIEYGKALFMAGCFYMTLGLFFLFKTLRRYFNNSKTVLWAVLITLFGTNLLFYTVQSPAMSHVHSFCLVSLLLWMLPKFWETPSVFRTFCIGFLLGLLVLIRPTHLIFILLFLLFDVKTNTDVKKRLLWCANNPLKMLIIPLTMAIFWLPQLAYWHYLTGSYLFYSYGNQGFPYWLTPRLGSVFFDMCNGFLIYSPVMLFALIGLTQTAIKNELNGRLISLVFSITAYVCASWWCWWFGQSYGYRAFIDFYPLLALGLAFYIDSMLKTPSKWLKYAHFAVFILFIFINIRMTTTPFQWHFDPNDTNATDYLRLIKWVFFMGNY